MMSQFKGRMISTDKDSSQKCEDSLMDSEPPILSLCRKVVDENMLNSPSYEFLVLEIYRLCGNALESLSSSDDAVVVLESDDNAPQVMLDLMNSDDDEVERVNSQVNDVASRSDEPENESKLNCQGVEVLDKECEKCCENVDDSECRQPENVVSKKISEDKPEEREVEKIDDQPKENVDESKILSPRSICDDKSESSSRISDQIIKLNDGDLEEISEDENFDSEDVKTEDDGGDLEEISDDEDFDSEDLKSEDEGVSTSSTNFYYRYYSVPIITNPAGVDFTEDLSLSWDYVKPPISPDELDEEELEMIDDSMSDITDTSDSPQSSTTESPDEIIPVSDDCLSIFADENEICDLFQNSKYVELDDEKIEIESSDDSSNDSTTFFISDNPLENADNDDTECEVWKKLETDEDRLRMVRLKWKNDIKLDPSINLTTHNYWFGRISSSSDDDADGEEINEFGKRQISIENGNKRRRRLIDEFENDENKARISEEEDLVDLGKNIEVEGEKLNEVRFSFQKNLSDCGIDALVINDERIDDLASVEKMYASYSCYYV